MKAAPLKLRPRVKGLPAAQKAKAAPKTPRRKVWTGAKKKIGVSPLQLALPGTGTTL